ncbi:hypothetical protein N7510_000492, partial [Penicillium lagena]
FVHTAAGCGEREALFKPHAGQLVVGWVTPEESVLLHVGRLHEITDVTSSHPAIGSENPYLTSVSRLLAAATTASRIDVKADTVFEGEEDVATVASEAKVVIDKPSLEFLHSSTIDYELIRSHFKIVNNSQHFTIRSIYGTIYI